MADPDAPDELIEMPGLTDPDLRRMLGLFDTPAFARRGQELAARREALRARCRFERAALLEMVRLRLRQWAAVATGPADGADVFDAPPGWLWDGCGVAPPAWAAVAAPPRRRRAAARDLVASVERFNRRWIRFVEGLDLGSMNQAIAAFNRYYPLEKECSLGSARLAARHFAPEPPVAPADLLAEFPPLPVPAVRG